jgi:glycosyltransferase involved in cell wall biosynthesis
VLCQDYPQGKIEIILIDDGSTDNTRKICLEHGAWSMEHGEAEAPSPKPHASCLKYIHQPNQGKAMVMKAGIEAAQGKYIFNLDADDVFLPGKIKKVVEIFELDKEIAYAAHPVIYWNEQKNTKNPEKFPGFLRGKVYGKDILRYFYKINKFYGCGSSFAGRAEILKKIPINRKEIGYSIDGYLVLFCANAGYAYFCDVPLSLYRVHDIAYSLKNKRERAKIDAEANEAILEEVKKGNFEEEIESLCTLKIKTSQLKTKEMAGNKTLSDIASLWSFVFKNRKKFGVGLFKLIKSYKLAQRSVRF